MTGDSFVAAGSSAAMRKLASPRTRIVDLKGAFVTPGLTDDHFHDEGGGPDVDLSRARSLRELSTIVANAAAATLDQRSGRAGLPVERRPARDADRQHIVTFRLLGGIAMGGIVPLAAAYTVEFFPARSGCAITG